VAVTSLIIKVVVVGAIKAAFIRVAVVVALMAIIASFFDLSLWFGL
jgi:hypothetical protein